jgi:hypothetical protein
VRLSLPRASSEKTQFALDKNSVGIMRLIKCA